MIDLELYMYEQLPKNQDYMYYYGPFLKNRNWHSDVKEDLLIKNFDPVLVLLSPSAKTQVQGLT